MAGVVDSMAQMVYQLADEGSTLEEVTVAATGLLGTVSNLMKVNIQHAGGGYRSRHRPTGHCVKPHEGKYTAHWRRLP